LLLVVIRPHLLVSRSLIAEQCLLIQNRLLEFAVLLIELLQLLLKRFVVGLDRRKLVVGGFLYLAKFFNVILPLCHDLGKLAIAIVDVFRDIYRESRLLLLRLLVSVIV